MIKPRALKSGDRIHITAPASPVRREMFEQGVQSLKGLGYRVTFDNPFPKWRYLAGKDEHRRQELVRALQDPEVAAIFFARGGYGSGRLLTGSKQLGISSPRIIHGSSDITSLHLYFERVHGWVVFHGPMPSGDFARGQVHIDSWKLAMTQTEPYILQPANVDALRAGEAEGALKGGCLTLLDAAIGTPWEPVWDDCVLFLEDVAVKPYQIDRMLTHLKTIGKFDKVRAFVFGEMKDCIQVPDQGYTLEEVILDILGDFNKPIFFGFPSGHVSGLNWTIPLGVQAKVRSNPSFALEILEGAVE